MIPLSFSGSLPERETIKCAPISPEEAQTTTSGSLVKRCGSWERVVAVETSR